MQLTNEFKNSKTIFEWLEELDEPYCSKALQNVTLDNAGVIAPDISSALCHAFSWDSSPEGFNFWFDKWTILEERNQADV